MPELHPLTIRVPINGKLLIKLDGFDTLHEVGAFTKELNVTLSAAGGNVDFRFDETFFEESIEANRGVAPPTPLLQHQEKSTYQIVLDVLKGSGVFAPEPLAERLCDRLGSEGRLSA